MLCVTQSNLGALQEGTTQRCEYQKMGLIAGHLEATSQMPATLPDLQHS